MARDHEGKEHFVDKGYVTKDAIVGVTIRWTDHGALLRYLWDLSTKGILELDVRKEEDGEVMNIRFTGVNK